MLFATLCHRDLRLSPIVALVCSFLLTIPPQLLAQGSPPSVSIGPLPGGVDTVHTADPFSLTITWCDDGGLDRLTRSVKLNGTALSSTWTLRPPDSNCGEKATSSVTITPQVGSNNIQASIEDNFGQSGTGFRTFTYDLHQIDITPRADSAQAAAFASFTQAFSIHGLTSSPGVYNLSVIQSGSLIGCAADSTQVTMGAYIKTVNVTCQTGALNSTGTVKLRAASASRSLDVDTGSVTVTASLAGIVASVSSPSSSKYREDPSLCVAECFDASYAHSTAPYFSMGAARNVTYVYHGDRVAVRPFIYADVSLVPGRSAPQEYWLEASVDWGSGAYTKVKWVNGDSAKIRFSGSGTSGKTIRLAGQFDASDRATNAYPMRVIVTAIYPDNYTEQYIDSSAKLIVVNDRSSPFGRGWTLSGLDQLYVTADSSVLVVEGSGAAIHFQRGAAANFSGPVGEFSKLSVSGSGSSTVYTRSFPDSSKITFDVNGRMTKAVDRWGNKVEYGYDAQFRLSTITDPFRRYDGSPTHTCIRYLELIPAIAIMGQIQEPGANGEPCTGRTTTTFVSTADSTLSGISDPDGKGASFVYDSRGRLSKMVGSRASDTTQYVYRTDSSWKLASVVMPRVPIDNGSGTTPQTPVVAYAPWQVVGVPTITTSATPAAPLPLDSVKAVITDPLGHATTFKVDRWGQPLKITDPLGNVTTIERGDAAHLFATEVIDPLGQTDQYSYSGPFLVVSHPHGQPATRISYDAWGMPDTISGGGQPTRTFTWNDTARTITAKISGLYPSVTYLDSFGRVTRVNDPANHDTYYHYEATFGNLDSTSNTARQWSKVKHDRYGRDSAITSSGAPTRRRIYDILNRDSLVYDGVNSSPLRFTHDASYTYTKVTDGKGQVYRTDLNKLGWPTYVYDPSDTVSWTKKQSYRYDLAGRVTSYQNRRGYWVNLQYDALGRLTSRRDPLAPADSFQYSPDGHIVVGSNSISVDSLILGTDGRDTAITWIAGKRFMRVHSPTAGSTTDTVTITSNVSGLEFLQRQYFWSQSRGVLDSVNLNQRNIFGSVSETVTFGYDGELLRNTITYPSFVRRDSATASHQSYFTSYSTSSIDTLFRRSYALDALGRVTQESRPEHADLDVRSFDYNGLGALSRYERSHADSTRTCEVVLIPDNGYFGCEVTGTMTPYETHKYGYDQVSNLRADTNSTTGVITNGTFSAGDRLGSWGVVTYTYDLDGNRIERDSATSTTYYDWTNGGKLYRVRASSGTISYDYNAFGELVRRSTNGTPDRVYLWDQGQLLAVLNAVATTRLAEYAYRPGVDQPLAYITNGPPGLSDIRYFQTDQRGNVVGLTYSNQASQHLLYDPWGTLEDSSGISLDETGLGWKGLMLEPGTGLYYVRARWYDSQSRSFISEDPIGIAGGINVYAFGANDPVNYSDPAGMGPVPIAGVVTYANVGSYGDWLFVYSAISGMLGGRGGIGDPLAGAGGGSGGTAPIWKRKTLRPTFDGECLSKSAWAGANILMDVAFGGSVIKLGGKAAVISVEAGARWLGHELTYATPEVAAKLGGVRFLPKAVKSLFTAGEVTTTEATAAYAEYYHEKADKGVVDFSLGDFIPYYSSYKSTVAALQACFDVVDK
jgi:RHS repeat-associated protein